MNGDPARPRVAFVVNGTTSSPMGERGRAFAARLQDRFDCVLVYRTGSRLASIASMFTALAHTRPAAVYVLDIAYSGIAASLLLRLLRPVALVVDTGDAITELARSMGRGRLGVLLTAALEHCALWAADEVVVRGTRHVAILAGRGVRRVTVIQDGVVPSEFVDGAGTPGDLRALLAPGAALTIGLVGSVTWSSRLQRCYGWELVEVLALIDDPRLHGILVGDGDGLPRLRARAEALGVAQRMAFVGRVPYDALPSYLGAMDICLSTQTNDAAGQVRTTGKLPLYLASGRFVLATDVGEASLVLSAAERVPFVGRDDPAYPGRLAERVRALLDDRRPIDAARQRNPAIAARLFDYDVLAERVAAVLDSALSRH